MGAEGQDITERFGSGKEELCRYPLSESQWKRSRLTVRRMGIRKAKECCGISVEVFQKDHKLYTIDGIPVGRHQANGDRVSSVMQLDHDEARCTGMFGARGCRA